MGRSLAHRDSVSCVCCLKCAKCVQLGGNRAEFYAYGVLHAASLGRGLLSQELCQLPRDILDDPFITHALSTVNAFRCAHCLGRAVTALRGSPAGRLVGAWL